MADFTSTQALLTETEVSKQLRVSLAALRKWRVLERGPQFLKIGSLVRYRQGDVDLWLESVPVGGGIREFAAASQGNSTKSVTQSGQDDLGGPGVTICETKSMNSKRCPNAGR